MSRKGENIYKRKDGRWEGRYLKHEPGGPRYGYVYARSYREVKQRLREAAAQWEARPQPEAPSPTVRDIAEPWLRNLAPRVKESTMAKYRTVLRLHILPQLGDERLQDLTHRRLDDFATELLTHGGTGGTPLSPRTVSDVMAVLRSMLRSAARDGAAVPNDGSTVRIPRPRKEPRILTMEEQNTLCAYLYKYRTPENMGILLSLYTGLRVGEICGLRWEDIDLAAGVLHVRRTVQRLPNPDPHGPRTYLSVTEPKSPSSLRSIPLPGEMTAMLTAMPTLRRGWFLTDDHRIPEPRRMQQRFAQVLRELDIPPANYHALRHTFATRCVELGFDVKALSEVLGHSTVSMTMDRYVHPTMAHKRGCMDRLTPLLRPQL